MAGSGDQTTEVTVIVSAGDVDMSTMTPTPQGFVIGCCHCEWLYGPAWTRTCTRKLNRHLKREHLALTKLQVTQGSMRARLESGDGDVKMNPSALFGGGDIPLWLVTYKEEKNGVRNLHDGMAALFDAAGVTDLPRGWRTPFIRVSDVEWDS